LRTSDTIACGTYCGAIAELIIVVTDVVVVLGRRLKKVAAMINRSTVEPGADCRTFVL
jgi:hypothetical protein